MHYEYASILSDEINEYIQFKRNSGLKYINQVDVLNQFDRHLMSNNCESKILNRETVMTFLRLKENERITNVANKTTTIRGLLKFLKEVKHYNNIFCEIPSLSQKGQADFVPYIFSNEEISKIIYYAQKYSKNSINTHPNMRNIVSCAFTMLYCTGMRLGEVVNLKVEDVDLTQRIIYIREAKNYNKRIVTISESLAVECERYCRESAKYNLSGKYFFDVGLPRDEGRVRGHRLYCYFRAILKKAGIKHNGKGNGPRLHDIRMTFCCHSLRQLSKIDGDINGYLVYLSTFLGHKSLLETQDYIWLTSELFDDTRHKMEKYTEFITDIYNEANSYEESI